MKTATYYIHASLGVFLITLSLYITSILLLMATPLIVLIAYSILTISLILIIYRILIAKIVFRKYKKEELLRQDNGNYISVTVINLDGTIKTLATNPELVYEVEKLKNTDNAIIEYYKKPIIFIPILIHAY